MEKTKVTNKKITGILKPENIAFLTPKLIEAQGKNDREFLTLRVKLLLDAKAKLPHESLSEIAKLADLTACGCGCCCCCNTLLIPGNDVIVPAR